MLTSAGASTLVRLIISEKLGCRDKDFCYLDENLTVNIISILLPPATKLRQGYVFTSVCQEFCPQGGRHAWQGDMHGKGVHDRGCMRCGGGACMPGGMCDGGHVWHGGMHGRGACVAGKTIAAGGTHPTGMHSCLITCSNQIKK